LGVPRFTMTAHGRKLFARMGSPVTSYADDNGGAAPQVGYLVGLDLDGEGRLLPGFPIPPDDALWTFEGSPVTDGTNLYVAMRHSDVHPQAHVACFDVTTGRLRWRSLICAAESAGRGQLEEVTHNLLTLHRGVIYYNTNLGAVAALRARDGAIKWITVYPRTNSPGDEMRHGTLHFYRDLNPCVFYRSMVLTAPADSNRIFALDAASGMMIWQSTPAQGAHGTEAMHLIGVGGGNLIASGDRLWWLDVQTGRIVGQFPDGGSTAEGHGAASPRGFGRGLLVGQTVYWPTRDRIYVFDQRTIDGRTPRKVCQDINLTVHKASGGNLLMSQGGLLIATAEEVIALSESGERPGVRERGME